MGTSLWAVGCLVRSVLISLFFLALIIGIGTLLDVLGQWTPDGIWP